MIVNALNSNIRCIEMVLPEILKLWHLELNSNIRCIEIRMYCKEMKPYYR